VLVVGLSLAGCTSGAPEGAAPGSSANQSPSARQAAVATPELDSIAVIGHSGATGTLTDPDDYRRDARENSWATGDNPRVQSLYLRLLADHPAMKGHSYNHAVNGTRVDDLPGQFRGVLAEADVLPDLVVIQSIDNDIRCDGRDAEYFAAFGDALDGVLTGIEANDPGVQFFLVSQWATVEAWASWAVTQPAVVQENSGTGPCDVFRPDGSPRPAGVRSLQAIVDGYWEQVVSVCARHDGCFTDDGAEQRLFVPVDADLARDLNHLSVEGHAKFAAIAWGALPEAVKQRT
jgi:hypothetical protein